MATKIEVREWLLSVGYNIDRYGNYKKPAVPNLRVKLQERVMRIDHSSYVSGKNIWYRDRSIPYSKISIVNKKLHITIS